MKKVYVLMIYLISLNNEIYSKYYITLENKNIFHRKIHEYLVKKSQNDKELKKVMSQLDSGIGSLAILSEHGEYHRSSEARVYLSSVAKLLTIIAFFHHDVKNKNYDNSNFVHHLFLGKHGFVRRLIHKSLSSSNNNASSLLMYILGSQNAANALMDIGLKNSQTGTYGFIDIQNALEIVDKKHQNHFRSFEDDKIRKNVNIFVDELKTNVKSLSDLSKYFKIEPFYYSPNHFSTMKELAEVMKKIGNGSLFPRDPMNGYFEKIINEHLYIGSSVNSFWGARYTCNKGSKNIDECGIYVSQKDIKVYTKFGFLLKKPSGYKTMTEVSLIKSKNYHYSIAFNLGVTPEGHQNSKGFKHLIYHVNEFIKNYK